MLNPLQGEIFCFDKPYAVTSFRIVSRVRGILGRRIGVKNLKVGHAGTLDPLATGVLIVCTGAATKQIDTLQAGTKEYIATLKLGATTPSFDRETAEDATYPTDHITPELVQTVLSRFTGPIEQVPPQFSAVKVDGKRAFKMARRGQEVELKPKLLVIDRIELLDCCLRPSNAYSEPLPHVNIKTLQADELSKLKQQNSLLAVMQEQRDYPSLTIRIACSKGTYIRALARDIGQALGSGAYLTHLIRTRVGDHRLEQAIDPDQFETYVAEQGV